ncbi:N-(5'-phosphoribosyl)anthranilate isomerase [Ventosimonas gracilis]|uniref:N-(5'-phosphoribosyl)anthranilate isomerase n=1 Tax=Ventosimonas gracilis TaxID=1680762 RepID=A0A139SJ35_9GAMM|nr:phosphoribosylanthranilate isomerase [Ventosimonas gracilis]KXU34585.1 N-(5'-phosphoribosyl)anthranilate isomerase [Ventosimonas gracilis]
MKVRCKICGITRPQDALAAVQAGADALGLVFYAESPRAVSLAQAKAIRAALPPFICLTGLFVNESREQIAQTLREVPLDLLQFHGDETPEDCAGFGRPWIKALRVGAFDDIKSQAAGYPNACGILLDSQVAGQYGGTGTVFDWSLIPTDLRYPLILAGGLNPQNVGKAIAQVRPFAVDVSGGVEAAKGIKDAQKMHAFIREVRKAEQAINNPS